MEALTHFRRLNYFFKIAVTELHTREENSSKLTLNLITIIFRRSLDFLIVYLQMHSGSALEW